MKDAQGHGSNGRGNYSPDRSPYAQGRNAFGIAHGASFSPRYASGQRAAEATRAIMKAPAHQTGIVHAVRNFLGV